MAQTNLTELVYPEPNPNSWTARSRIGNARRTGSISAEIRARRDLLELSLARAIRDLTAPGLPLAESQARRLVAMLTANVITDAEALGKSAA